MPDKFLPKLIDLWRQGGFPVDQVISQYDFDEINQAAHDLRKGAWSNRSSG